MSRQARLLLENTPHHIVQRGQNGEAIFTEEGDYNYYLENLKECKEELSVKVYGYCLMLNHVHLILDPCEDVASFGKLIKRLASRQTRFVNHKEKRTGSLWDGRYRSSPIEAETYLLACNRYVELNPVKAGIVEQAKDYHWSSYQQKVGMETMWIDQDSAYLDLSDNEMQRRQRYMDYINGQNIESETQLIQKALQRGQLTGTSRFVDQVEHRLGQRIEHRGPGRPRREKI